MKKISIIIPVWNEEKNIIPLVERIHTAFKRKNEQYEIIFVDDHSTDNTQSEINKILRKYPIVFLVKQGRKGKAYSLFEGLQSASFPYVACIDADLQYPPEAIIPMLQKLENGSDIVVANRINQKISPLRKFTSTSFRNLFGKTLFGLDCDIQSGLKVFRKNLVTLLDYHPSSGWTFDLEFLHLAQQAGFQIDSFDITFEERLSGRSKVSFLTTSVEIGFNALQVKSKSLSPVPILPIYPKTMRGAGVRYKMHKYITHTTLPHAHSAIITFTSRQRIFASFIVTIILLGFFTQPLLTIQILIGTLSFVYFTDVLFNLFLILKSLHFPQEIITTKKEIDNLNKKSLPIYSILCPLYKEAHIIPQFLDAIKKLDYPKNKLDVMLLLEEDDTRSLQSIKKMELPGFVRTIVVPHSFPKTKPKACNYGLSFAKGTYLVIYDAEDMPDPLQLKKALIGFQKAGRHVVCLQAMLNYYNPHQNLLTRFFTAEYSLWFDVTLTGLQAANTSIPLGGTSNHFRTEDIRKLEGWDPFNVTEDADLGMRLFKRGFKTAIIDSVTLEEANSNVSNWIRQRSRWIKGYMQTYLVHTREAFGMKNKNLWHAFLFQLTIGGKIAFILINPLLWIATISYFVLNKFVGPTIESLYPTTIFYVAAFSLTAGNFLFLYYYMIGCAKREQWSLIKYVYFVPFYWLLISCAGFVALYQLIFKPHYWEKTIHGLYSSKKNSPNIFSRFNQNIFIPF
ncbi:MAG TPA: glycosyltransferase, partial [Candidatus Saccharimonadales bacterium]|nr:glycosyltransferase [Candidatus Saccharimonadales bacterium]